MKKVFFIAGATGFVGEHLVKAMKERGLNARCLVRDPVKSPVCSQLGFESHAGDITDRESLRGALEGAETVVHLVGIIEEKGSLGFRKVHVEGTENLVSEAKAAGVERFFYQSALGASLDSKSSYLKTKAEAEEIVKGSGMQHVIFRPSLIIGNGDGFTERMMKIIKAAPVIPVPGRGEARFQPLFIGDWIKCFFKAEEDRASKGRSYDLGGPEQITYNDILRKIMKAMGVRKKIIHIPLGLAYAGLPVARGLSGVFTPGVPAPTIEQLSLLNTDNVCRVDAVKDAFGFEPEGFEEALESFISPRV